MATGKIRNELLVCAALIALGLGDAAAASTTYSISGDWNSSVFKYGRGTGGSSFTPYSTHSACAPQLDCYQIGQQASVLKNLGTTAYTGSTLHIDPGTVNLHPSEGLGNTDAIVRFVSPITTIWQVASLAWRNDVTGYGNGTTASIFLNIGNTSQLYGSLYLAPNSYGMTSGFLSFPVAMSAGDSIDFAVNNIGGDFQFDSTGIEASFYSRDNVVPEPATWALLIIGFCVVGVAARRRRAGDAVLA